MQGSVIFPHLSLTLAQISDVINSLMLNIIIIFNLSLFFFTWSIWFPFFMILSVRVTYHIHEYLKKRLCRSRNSINSVTFSIICKNLKWSLRILLTSLWFLRMRRMWWIIYLCLLIFNSHWLMMWCIQSSDMMIMTMEFSNHSHLLLLLLLLQLLLQFQL